MCKSDIHDVERIAPIVFLNSHIHIGTCAWTLDDWRGSFYPGDCRPAAGWPGTPASSIPSRSTPLFTVPLADTVARWLADAPAHFRFTCKVPKTITHELRLRDCEGLLADFLEAMRPLHGRLGAILIQLPPSFTPARDSTALRDFVLALPHGWRFAIEFRHADWHQPRFVKLLEDPRHLLGMERYDLRGRSGSGAVRHSPRDYRFSLRPPPGRPRLQVRRRRQTSSSVTGSALVEGRGNRELGHRHRKQAEHVKNIYIFCDDHYEGFAPVTCRDLGFRLGVEFTFPAAAVPEPASRGPRQMDLPLDIPV